MSFTIKFTKVILTITLSIILLIPVFYCVSCLTYKETLEYDLQEIDDGVYGYYNIVASAIPAQNYEVITLYFGGGIYTLRGDVNIHYNAGKPKLIWERTKTVNGDRMDVYIPEGSLEIRPNMTVG